MRRHDLVDVDPAAWAEAVGALDLPGEAPRCVAQWVRRGRPAMIRRRLAGDGEGEAPLAIQLPNAAGRLRLALAVPLGAVRPRAPVLLEEVRASAPPSWQPTIRALLSLRDMFGTPTVYGGLLWQHLTGEAVLRETSDLDLLWHPAPERRAALIEALAAFDGPPRLDGEIVLEDGAGIAWRELHAAMAGRASSVAAKTLDGVTLRDAFTILREPVPC